MSTQQQLAVTYDLPYEFFSLWLDKETNYSCALFNNLDETLEEAQRNKLAFFHQSTKLTAQSRVLDIGCGWGGNLEFLSREMGLSDLTGITLSRAQYETLVKKSIPGTQIECVSYADYKPADTFDAIISIGMFEHLATPEETRSGKNLEIYRNYFRLAWEWTRPGARFGLQSVISTRIPRDRQALKEIGWTTRTIFPGAISPRLELIITALSPYWEVVELYTRRKHYERTATEWLNRLNRNETLICNRWGRQTFLDYQRYLGSCIMAFANGYQSLVQMVLRRADP